MVKDGGLRKSGNGSASDTTEYYNDIKSYMISMVVILDFDVDNAGARIAAMELRHMRHFIAVAEELHFGRAAERLNMAQPPLSQSIMRLEQELGVRLLDRTRRGVWLTAPGAVFLEEARRTLMQAELTRRVTQRTAAADTARIDVSFIGPAMYRILPMLLLEHRTRNPDVDIRLFERTSPDQMAGILDGSFDIAFVFSTIDLIEGGDSFIVERCPLAVAVHADSPLAARPSVRLAELADMPMILPPKALSPTRVGAMLAACRGAGFVPNVVQEAAQTNTVLNLVAAGLGIALVGATARLAGLNKVRLVPIEDAPESLCAELAIVWSPQHLSPSARAFVEMARDYVAKHPELTDMSVGPVTDGRDS